MGERLKSEVRFGKYSLIERLAVGGMAEIFLARQAGVEGFEKVIVIKKIRSHLSRQKSFVNMFLNEAKLAAQLNHPNIVQIYDLGRIGESYFIAMEYVHGRDMRAVLPRAEHLNITPFPLEYALKICSNVCEGLFYAHGKTDSYGAPLGIVHRDISPENILVSFDGGVKLTDFGIAKATTQLEHTRAGEIKGKLSYMSPEQCRGEKVDQRSDLFSLGVVLYEWFTGVKLFTGDSELEILQSIINGKIYPASYFREDIPDEVDAILEKALAIDREERYQSAWDMQYDIDTFLASHEFTPSNVHVANFMKQLFAEDLERDRKRAESVGEAAREASGRSSSTRRRRGATGPRESSAVLTPEELGAEVVEEGSGIRRRVESLDDLDEIVELEPDDSDVLEQSAVSEASDVLRVASARLAADRVDSEPTNAERRISSGVRRKVESSQRRRVSSGASTTRLSTVLSREGYARLIRIAERRGENPEELAADMLEALLRFSE